MFMIIHRSMATCECFGGDVGRILGNRSRQWQHGLAFSPESFRVQYLHRDGRGLQDSREKASRISDSAGYRFDRSGFRDFQDGSRLGKLPGRRDRKVP